MSWMHSQRIIASFSVLIISTYHDESVHSSSCAWELLIYNDTVTRDPVNVVPLFHINVIFFQLKQ